MKEKILILGASSFAGYSFSKYLLKKKFFKVYGTYASNRNKKILSYKKTDKLKLSKIDLQKNHKKLIKLVKELIKYKQLEWFRDDLAQFFNNNNNNLF